MAPFRNPRPNRSRGRSRYADRLSAARSTPADSLAERDHSVGAAASLTNKPEVPTKCGRMNTLFPNSEGGTIVGDNVVYAVPGGQLVQKLFVAPDLDRIFHYRHEVLRNIFNPKQLQPIEHEER